MSLPNLLYVSPVIPALTGNGLAMRAGTVLERLARHYRISLLVMPIYPPYSGSVPPPLAALCTRIEVRSPQPVRTVKQKGLRAHLFGGRHHADTTALEDLTFDVVHVFRLAAVPFARPFLRRAGERHLDLDDIESVTHRRLAALYRSNGNEAMARLEDAQAERAAALEEEVLREFDRVYVCSDVDRARLQPRSPAEVRTLPNVVRVPASVGHRSPDTAFTFLFAGTLGYYPNEDAARYFCHAVLPILRETAPGPFAVSIVGDAPGEEVGLLGSLPQVQLVGPVPDMGLWYASAGAVVVPIRAGGGTRIKLLEAFAHRRPVVSTTLGAEGIDAQDGEHLLIADTPGSFAAHCTRLMSDEQLVQHLVDNAFSLLMNRYALATPETASAPSALLPLPS